MTETSSSGELAHTTARLLLNCNGSAPVDAFQNNASDPENFQASEGDRLKLTSWNEKNNATVEMLDAEVKNNKADSVQGINGHEAMSYSNKRFRSSDRAGEAMAEEDASQALLCEKQAKECVNLLRSLSENCDSAVSDSQVPDLYSNLEDEHLSEITKCHNVFTQDLSSNELSENLSECDMVARTKVEYVSADVEEHRNNIQPVDSHNGVEIFLDDDTKKNSSSENSLGGEQSSSFAYDPSETNDGTKYIPEICNEACVEMKNISETSSDIAVKISKDFVADSELKSIDAVDDSISKFDVIPTVDCLTDNREDKLNGTTSLDETGLVSDTVVTVIVSINTNNGESLNTSSEGAITEVSSSSEPQCSTDEAQSAKNSSEPLLESCRPVPVNLYGSCAVSGVRGTVPAVSNAAASVSSSVTPDVSLPPEQRKAAKSPRTKTPSDNVRPVGRILHDLGLDIVRQEVYKDLIDIQATKDFDHRLSENEKGQLVKLADAHTKLKTKNHAYNLPRKRCAQCRYSCTSLNVLHMHHEYGHFTRDDVHVCCICDYRTRFPSQFITHMEFTHKINGRQYKKLSVYICPYCPFENKKADRVEFHSSRCVKKFNINANLQPLPSDCDIAIRYKPVNWLQQTQTTNIQSSEPMRPQGSQVFLRPGGDQSSNVMEIGGKMYSMGNQRGKPVLTSLRPQAITSPPFVGSRSNFQTAPVNRASMLNTVSARSMAPFQVRTQHESIMTMQRRETCEICGSPTNSRQAMWAHMRAAHKCDISQASMSEKDPCISCEMCTARFWTYQGLARHSIHTHKRSFANYDASSANAQSPFTSIRSSFSSSIRGAGQAAAQPAFRCFLCGASQPNLNPLNHLSTVHNITLLTMYNVHQCYICNRKLRSGPGFEDHMVLEHRDIFANVEVLRTVLQALSSAVNLKSDEKPVHQLGRAPSAPRPLHTSQTAAKYGNTAQQQFQYQRMMMMNSPGDTRYRAGMRAPQQYAASQRSAPQGFKNVRSSMPPAARYRSPMIGPGIVLPSPGAQQRKPRTQPAAPPTVPLVKTPDKKNTEEEEKLLNKLYEDYADIGRPISRAMKQKLLTASPGAVSAGKDDGRSVEKRQADASPDGSGDIPTKKQCLSPSTVGTQVAVDANVDVNEGSVEKPIETVAPIV